MRGRLFAATVVALGLTGATLSGTAVAGGDPSPPSWPTGSFAIGDGNNVAGQSVEFWGAQWAKDNTVSGGAAPDAFKGFADVTTSTPGSCSGSFTTAPGNSSAPPATLSGGSIDVLVVNSVTKDGDLISGTFDDVVDIAYDPGYAGDPGHPGTGTIIGDCAQGTLPGQTGTGGTGNNGGGGTSS